MVARSACVLTCLLLGCDRVPRSSAPAATQTFVGSIGAAPTRTDGGNANANAGPADAGAPDSGMTVCTPGQVSVGLAFSSHDPCDQSSSSCTLSASTAVAMCLPDGTWSPTCYCYTAGMTPSGTAGTGSGASGTGF